MDNAAQSARLISKGQLRRLQALYGQLARHTQAGPAHCASAEEARAARIAWAGQLVGREVASFNDLTGGEARRLIDTLQGQLGVNAPAQRRRRGRPRLDSDAAHRAGTEGRRDGNTKQVTLAGAAEFARIQYALDELGWNQAQLDGWLRSPRSPLKKSAPEIRTLGQANSVWWALKGMLDRKKRRA